MKNKCVSPLNKDEQIKLLKEYLDCGGLEKNGQMNYYMTTILNTLNNLKGVKKALIFISIILISNGVFGVVPSAFSYTNNEFDYLNITLKGNVKTINIINHRSKGDFPMLINYLIDSCGNIQVITTNSWYAYSDSGHSWNNTSTFNFYNGKLNSIHFFNQPMLKNKEVIDINALNRRYEYDKNGNILFEKKYHNNNLSLEDQYSYTENGLLIEKRECFYGYDNKNENLKYRKKAKHIYYKSVFEYDKSGNIITKTNYHKSKPHKKYFYKYDNSGNLIEDGWLPGRMIGKKTYNPLFKYKYNIKGQKIAKISVGNFMPKNTNTFYEYNYMGKLSSLKGFYIKSDTTLGYHYIYRYDSIGQKILEQQLIGSPRTIDWQEYVIKRFEYDRYSNLISEKYLNDNNETIHLVRFEYKYDEKGNWVFKKKFIKCFGEVEQLVEYCERTINYYK